MNTHEILQELPPLKVICIIKELIFNQYNENFTNNLLLIPKKEIYHQVFTSKFYLF
jgi:hypothetical protein